MGIREETEKKVFAYIEEHGMIGPGEKIVAGVSGGADSVCLLALLLAYGERVPLRLSVVHVNHRIRREAGEDARYVEELCAGYGVPFLLEEADVRGFALAERCSEEDAGRRIRYGAFRRAAVGGRIAVAHNADDNAETMLFHLFRGSGLKGLSGIAPVRAEEGGLLVIRPILCLERREVEAYLRERGIPWRSDATNDGDGYCRNRIRHHILPYAEREVCAGAVAHMGQAARLLQEAEGYLQEQAREALEKCLLGDGQTGEAVNRYTVNAETFRNCHGALRGRMVLLLLQKLSPTGKDISAVHVRDVLALFSREGNRRITLPFGIAAERRYGQVILERTAEPAGSGSFVRSSFFVPVTLSLTEELFRRPAVHRLGEQGEMDFFAFFLKKEQELPRNQYTKWFDYDKIIESVTIRPRRRGDFLTIADGAGGVAHKSLKDYMIGEKIPRQLRDEIPLVAMGSHVLWAVGWRISEYFKVDGATRRVLQIRVRGAVPEEETKEKTKEKAEEETEERDV